MDIKFKNFLWLCVFIGGIFFVSGVAYPWCREGYFTGRGDRPTKEGIEEDFKKLSKEIGLTPEQEQRLKDLKAKNIEETKELRKLLKEKREELAKELEKEELNMDRINQLNRELKDIQSQKQDHRLNSILEIRKILTAEQYKKFREFGKKRFGDMKEKRRYRLWHKGAHCDERN